MGEVGQLVAVVTVLPGAHVHAVPPPELAEPPTLLLRLAVGVQHYTHPQGPCTHTVKNTHVELFLCIRSLSLKVHYSNHRVRLTCDNNDLFSIYSTGKWQGCRSII